MSVGIDARPQKPSAVVDYSLFNPLCAQSELVQTELWSETTRRYQLVIPFTLVEEIWKDIVFPDGKDTTAIRSATTAMYAMHKWWIDDPLSIAFKELVLGEAITEFPPPPKHIKDALWVLDNEDPKLIEYLKDRRLQKEKRTKEIIAEQDALLPPGAFCFVESKKAFFDKCIRDKFAEMVADPKRAKKLLEKVIGRDFRIRYPGCDEKIDLAFAKYNDQTFINYPMTLHYIMADMYYFYAPLMRIGKKGQPDARKIIGRSFHDQINNVEDEKYVISGLMCSRVLTCDRGMANILELFKDAGLWKGEVIHFERSNLQAQIPSKFI
jgi:hypothetical protein